MPKSNHDSSVPTPRRSKRVPLKILPPRHFSKAIWAKKTAKQRVQIKKLQREYCCDRTFLMLSKSKPDQQYNVVCDEKGDWTCTCPDFVYRSATYQARYGPHCKHVVSCIDTVLDK